MNLDVIHVAEPCTVDWNSMTGDAQVRHCGLCEKNVYDLSTLSRTAAETLIEAHVGRLCVRFYRRADGTVQTSDCQPIRDRIAAAARRTRRRLAAVCGGLFAVIGLSTLATRLSRASSPEPLDLPQTISADLAAPPSTQPADPPAIQGRTMGIVALPTTQPTTRPMLMGEIGPPPTTPSKRLAKPAHPLKKRS